MALPPTPAPAGAPPPDLGAPLAAAPDAGADAGGWNVKFTVMEGPDGQFALVEGDEPEMDMGGGEPPGPKFPDFNGAVRAMIEKVEGGGDDMKANFNEGFDKGSMANDQRPGLDMPMPRGG